MIDDNLNSAIATLTVALQKYDKTHITGALLGELVRREAPQLNLREVMKLPVGPGVITAFVAEHLKNLLSRDGKQGSDILYLINKDNVKPQLEVGPKFWEAFVRSHGPNMLVVEGNSLKTIPRTDQPQAVDSKLIIVSSATNEELEQIRSEFVLSLGEKGAVLPAIHAPYSEWIHALRELGADHVSSWVQYRPQKIVAIFDKKLEELSIEQGVRETLCRILRHSHAETKQIGSPNKAKHEQMSHALNAGNAKNAELNFRKMVLEVIGDLAITDLREIKLPAGAMFDAMINSIKK